MSPDRLERIVDNLVAWARRSEWAQRVARRMLLALGVHPDEALK